MKRIPIAGRLLPILLLTLVPLTTFAGQNKLYWTDTVEDRIQRSNLDGRGIETLIVDWFGSEGLGLDLFAATMYFGSGPLIWRAELDGTNITEVVDGQGWVTGVAVDAAADAVPASSPITLLAATLLFLAAAALLRRH